MASMVAMTSNNVTQTLPADKSSRNKRKFRADPPIGDPNKFVSLSDYDLPIYEFPSPITEVVQSHESHSGCKMCSSYDHTDPLKLGLGLPTGVESFVMSTSQPKDEDEAAYGFLDWADITETELEELALNNLEMNFRGAIKKLVACGYSENVVNKVILRSGVYYGPRDMVSNIVDNTLSFIRNGHEIDPSKEYYFENLEQMEKYIFTELVCVLREARPSFSTGDALWCLLLSDMNINSACSIDGNSSTDAGPSGSTPQAQFMQPTQPEVKTETPSSEFCFSATSKPKPCPQTCECKAIPVSAVPNFIKAKKSSINPISSTDCENKSVCTRKISGFTKRDILHQKSIPLERAYRTYGSKSSSRSGKHLSSFGSLVLDKKLRSLSESAGVNFKSATVNLTTTKTETKSDPPKTVSQPNIEKKTDTELSLSFPSQWTPYSKKDVMLMRLLPRERALNDQLRLWNEWANEKVMQVAKRLGKDKAELKALRQEREEAERARREKQTLEENTMKKLAELENAFRKAGGQMEWANGAIRRLEGENAWLRKEMEAARTRAKDAAASCRERVKGEKEAAARIQSWEKEKGMFRDELAAEKRKREQLDREVKLAEDRRDQEEARLKQEQKGKDELLKKAYSIRKEREELGVLAKSQEETSRLNAETNLKKYKDGIQKLEQEISQLRLKNDSSKIAAMRRGVDPQIRDLSRNKIANFKCDFSGVKRDRECVMCLSEEMSVVFLPCAHQVVCGNCNDLHEKQGMKECPSCRSPIQKRVPVRYARH